MTIFLIYIPLCYFIHIKLLKVHVGDVQIRSFILQVCKKMNRFFRIRTFPIVTFGSKNFRLLISTHNFLYSGIKEEEKTLLFLKN